MYSALFFSEHHVSEVVRAEDMVGVIDYIHPGHTGMEGGVLPVEGVTPRAGVAVLTGAHGEE